MKNLIRKWLDIPTNEELYTRIDRKVQSKVDKRYKMLRKADQQRYRGIAKSDNTTL